MCVWGVKVKNYTLGPERRKRCHLSTLYLNSSRRHSQDSHIKQIVHKFERNRSIITFDEEYIKNLKYFSTNLSKLGLIHKD